MINNIVKIRLEGNAMDQKGFSWAAYSNRDREWLNANVGKVFEAQRVSINAYHIIENGICVHIYDAMEVK